MKAAELRQLFRDGGKRFAVVGDEERGAIVGLDLEARIFALRDGEVVNRVNPDAVTGRSDRQGYFNPGGDGLWPAPEGTSLGYEYATGAWEVPSGLVSARFFVEDSGPASLAVGGEVALVNNSGLGIPCRFRRRIAVDGDDDAMKLTVVESIVYRGIRPLSAREAALAPWSLCQFDVKAGVFMASFGTTVRPHANDAGEPEFSPNAHVGMKNDRMRAGAEFAATFNRGGSDDDNDQIVSTGLYGVFGIVPGLEAIARAEYLCTGDEDSSIGRGFAGVSFLPAKKFKIVLHYDLEGRFFTDDAYWHTAGLASEISF